MFGTMSKSERIRGLEISNNRLSAEVTSTREVIQNVVDYLGVERIYVPSKWEFRSKTKEAL